MIKQFTTYENYADRFMPQCSHQKVLNDLKSSKGYLSIINPMLAQEYNQKNLYLTLNSFIFLTFGAFNLYKNRSVFPFNRINGKKLRLFTIATTYIILGSGINAFINMSVETKFEGIARSSMISFQKFKLSGDIQFLLKDIKIISNKE
jgi:hypothetical protein